MFSLLLLLSVLASGTCSDVPVTDDFPADFLFGVSSSAYQIEGGWNEDGKGKNIWDVVSHTPGQIKDNSTGDVACDSYHRLERDIDLLKQLGVDSYRFSISWSRVLPTGTLDEVNEVGVAYYNDLLKKLSDENIEPLVTLYHFDLPQKLQDQGGWTNSSSVGWFMDYADFIFSRFGDRVKWWVTINEPIVLCNLPSMLTHNFQDMEQESFICSKNVLMAHAAAYRLYRGKYKTQYNGKIAIADNYLWVEAEDSDKQAQDSKEILLQYFNGRFSHPIHSRKGGWPPTLVEYMEKVSKARGYNTSILPPFTDRERRFIRGTTDYLPINYYYTLKFKVDETGSGPTAWQRYKSVTDRLGLSVDSTIYPVGLRRVMNWLTDSYGSRDFLITENGYPAETRDLDDMERIEVIKKHLEQIQLAINEDNYTILGYQFWSLMDNFEWNEGYTQRFGLYDIDFADPERVATPRLSSAYYTCITKNRTLAGC